MKALNYTELDRCLLNNAPLQLPEKLRKRVDSIIEAFSYAKTNPYEDYFAIKRGEKRELINLGEKSDFWYRYLKYLKRYNKCLCIVQGDLIKKWIRLSKKCDNYDELFDYIVEEYCSIENYEQIQFDEKSSELKKQKSKIEKNFDNFVEKAQKVYDDFSVYFKYNTVSDAIKQTLQKNSYMVNDSIAVMDEEYTVFMESFASILQKLKNFSKMKKDRTMGALQYLKNPKSRKHNIGSANAMLLARKLSIFCKQYFNCAQNSMIASIISVLYNDSDLIENDIAKLNKKITEKRNILRENIKATGYDAYTHIPIIIPVEKSEHSQP